MAALADRENMALRHGIGLVSVELGRLSAVSSTTKRCCLIMAKGQQNAGRFLAQFNLAAAG